MIKLKETHSIKSCDKLLLMAKKVFGDVVINAYVAHYIYIGDGDKEKESHLNYTIETILDYNVKSYDKKHDSFVLHYDDISIILTFSNGRNIFFSASEWASMTEVEI